MSEVFYVHNITILIEHHVIDDHRILVAVFPTFDLLHESWSISQDVKFIVEFENEACFSRTNRDILPKVFSVRSNCHITLGVVQNI